jgi:aspartate kinase
MTIELAFYGATVIHPKHIQPLQKNSFVCKSFINPLLKGTSVSKGKLRTVFTVLYR